MTLPARWRVLASYRKETAVRRGTGYGRSGFGRGRLSFSRTRLFSPARRVVVKARVVRHQDRS
ncbi:hypothetical protein CCR92_12315 [Rhodospirillum rubrum]|nr:hypothetical protein [Rhodospirillum rubrum]HCF18177.1 hypothetical protein [Rhodospirillum rubrum]